MPPDDGRLGGTGLYCCWELQRNRYAQVRFIGQLVPDSFRKILYWVNDLFTILMENIVEFIGHSSTWNA